MKSPFPGMDPFIEGCGLWEDFHGHLIEKIAETLVDTLPASYLVRTGERAYVVLSDTEGTKSHSFKPDVTVADGGGPKGTATAVAEPKVKTPPFYLRAFIEEEFRERFVEIREAEGDRLVTCIEVLSPANKKPNSTGWDQYQRKRQALFLSHTANLIEIDLLRGGQRMPMVDQAPASPYLILVSRKHDMPVCQVWDAYFDRPLPAIPVPLNKPDPDAQLDLQPLVDAIYQRWRFARQIDYTRPLVPSPSDAELASLNEHLRTRRIPT